jgi:hypothetical protein
MKKNQKKQCKYFAPRRLQQKIYNFILGFSLKKSFSKENFITIDKRVPEVIKKSRKHK